MKKILCLIIIIISFSGTAFPCDFIYKIKKTELENYPILSYIDINEETVAFYIYLKDEGNFKGIESAAIQILSPNDNQLQFGSGLIMNQDSEKKILTIGSLEINKKLISSATLFINAYQLDKTSTGWFSQSIHSSVFEYQIQLQDIYNNFKSKENAYTTHSIYNKYNDDTLKAFIEKEFKMKRGHDL
ncbi:hypothetical protein [Desulforegula conservatrix]|uniref:hypothetical protein n=1 Tax=Desulforegula conservatrix TaxID=153026 RepID=UPI0004819B2E|nr:hypothetical protein [Desulforegula conservatrix]